MNGKWGGTPHFLFPKEYEKSTIQIIDKIVASLKLKRYFCIRFFSEFIVNTWRGAGVVTEQIANLSAGNCRLGSSPSLSAMVS